MKKERKKLDIAKIIPRNIRTRFTNRIYKLNVSYEGQKVLVSKAKEKHCNNYIERWINIPKNCICIWYKWPSGKNQNTNKNNGFRYKYLILPRYMRLNKLTLISLGLLEAEMETSVKNSCQVSFTNSEPELINHTINFFKFFRIKPDQLHWNITFNYKLLWNETSEITKLREGLSESFWIRNTMISPTMKNKKYLFYTGNKRNPNFDKDTIKWGTLKISCYDYILRKIILNLLKEIKKKLMDSNDPKLIQNYLKGIFAGECDIKLTMNGSVDSVRISCTNRSNKIFYRRCLRGICINASGFDKNSVPLHNQENFIKIYKLGLVELHPVRYNKFLLGLLNFKKFGNSEIKKTFIHIRNDILNKIKRTEPELIKRETLFGEINEFHSMVQRKSIKPTSVTGWKRASFG